MLQRVKLEDMIQSGMHFGHSTREWNPRMAPYIYGERNGRHILDLVQTYYLLHKVLNFIEENELVHNQPVEFEGISVDFKKIFEKRT
jgi:ribosomal protein S2